jgi:hypothetical protein
MQWLPIKPDPPDTRIVLMSLFIDKIFARLVGCHANG